MRKASAIVTYIDHKILNITINHKGNYIPFEPTQQEYTTFQDMYKDVLQISKMNDFYFTNYNAFNRTWYDIAWIDAKEPTRINKYGYKNA